MRLLRFGQSQNAFARNDERDDIEILANPKCLWEIGV
jgi:hypothetical protein